MFFINLNFTTVYQHQLYTFIVDTLQIISSDQYKDHKTQQQNNASKRRYCRQTIYCNKYCQCLITGTTLL